MYNYVCVQNQPAAAESGRRTEAVHGLALVRKQPAEAENELHAQSMYNYICVRNQMFDADYGNYVTYGIRAFQDHRMVGYIPDISTNRSSVEQMASLFNKIQLHTVHLLDVVSDILI